MNKCGLYLRKQHQLFVNNEYEVFEKFKYYNYDEIAVLFIVVLTLITIVKLVIGMIQCCVRILKVIQCHY